MNILHVDDKTLFTYDNFVVHMVVAMVMCVSTGTLLLPKEPHSRVEILYQLMERED